MKLQSKFFIGLLLIFIFLSVELYLISNHWIRDINMTEAQQSVEVHMDAAWDIYNQKRSLLFSKLEVIIRDKNLISVLKAGPDRERIMRTREEFESMRKKLSIDILNLIGLDGRVIFRTRPPYHSGDRIIGDPMLDTVMKTGECSRKDMIVGKDRLAIEGDDLVDYCMKNGGKAEGLLMGCALPVYDDEVLLGYLQSGVFLNGTTDIVDKIRDTIFYNTEYRGKPLGTATIFMGNVRISTNVKNDQNERAIGTMVSEEVRKRVLEQGKSWIGKAMVLDHSYLSRYDAIRDASGKPIGMLYVGELEEKYSDMKRLMIKTLMKPIITGLFLAFLIFFILTRLMIRPLKELSDATQKLGEGEFSSRIRSIPNDEIGKLAGSFNAMSEHLEARDRKIRDQQKQLKRINAQLKTTNKNYMEILGFVSHELKNRLASVNMRIYSLKNEYFGKLNKEQLENIVMVSKSMGYFNEIIKNYLDLSRHEKGEFKVRKTVFDVNTDVLQNIIRDQQNDLEEKGMILENNIPPGLTVNADMNMIRIVFDNLIANAVKYGKEGGRIILSSGTEKNGTFFSVLNDGDGIPKDKLKLLFKKFSRIESAASEGKKGTGLGLFICREIIGNHGGWIRAESEEGKWARFSFLIP